jgi:hypothetical protein
MADVSGMDCSVQRPTLHIGFGQSVHSSLGHVGNKDTLQQLDTDATRQARHSKRPLDGNIPEGETDRKPAALANP